MYRAVVMYNIIMKLFHKKWQKGFTAPELLIAIGMLALIFTITVATIPTLKAKSRDAQRVNVISNIVAGVELYKKDHGEYPWPTTNKGSYKKMFRQVNADGSCGDYFSDGGYTFHIDNSHSPGWLETLYKEGYITFGKWKDPGDMNCRYNGLCDPDTDSGKNCDVIKYVITCPLEKNDELMENDGGHRDDLYEIMGPDDWVCVEKCPASWLDCNGSGA